MVKHNGKIFIKSVMLMGLLAVFGFQMINYWEDNFTHPSLEETENQQDARLLDKEYLLISNTVEVFYASGEIISINRISEDFKMFYDEMIIVTANMLKTGQAKSNYMTMDQYKMYPKILFELQIPLSTSMLEREFPSSGVDLHNISQVDAVSIMKGNDGEVILAFVDYELNKIMFVSSSDESAINSSELLVSMKDQVKNKDYTSLEWVEEAREDDYQIVTAPIPSENLIYDLDLLFKNPFLVEAGLDQEEVEKYVASYFDNPSVVIVEENEEGSLRFYDDLVEVTYNTDGVIAYNKVITDKEKTTSIVDAYNIAEAFLEIDKRFVALDMTLRTYESDGKSTTFYYDYWEGQFPVVLHKGLEDRYQMHYPVEVTVENKMVKSCKRIVLQKEELMPQKTQLTADYIEMLQHLYEVNGVKADEIDRIYLGYYWHQDHYFDIKWFVNYKKTRYVSNVF